MKGNVKKVRRPYKSYRWVIAGFAAVLRMHSRCFELF